MLNIKELEKQFDEILASFSSQDVEDWLHFVAYRELEDKLQRGETVVLKCDVYKIANVEDKSIKDIIFDKNLMDYNLGIAA